MFAPKIIFIFLKFPVDGIGILYYNSLGSSGTYADVAQSVEQLIRNQQVSGSSPLISSKEKKHCPFAGWCFSICGYSSSVECKLPKLERRVRFPLPAPLPKRFLLRYFFASFYIYFAFGYRYNKKKQKEWFYEKNHCNNTALHDALQPSICIGIHGCL